MKKIFKSRRLFIYFFVINILCILNINSVYADLWGDSVPPAPCTNCTYGISSSVFESQNMVATGYRISILDSSGEAASGTHSVDYWPQSDEVILSNGICQQGFVYFTKKCTTYKLDDGSTHWGGKIRTPKWKTVSPKKAKTESGSRSVLENQVLSIGRDNQYDFIVSKNTAYKSSTWTAIGGAGPGDTTYNQNYTKVLLQELNKRIDKKSHTQEDYELVGELFLRSNFGNSLVSNKNSVTAAEYKKIVADASSKNLYIAVEPIMAIHNNKVETTYVGTPYEMASVIQYSRRPGLQWAYARYSYLHPIVYAYDSSAKKIAGINTCTKINSTEAGTINPDTVGKQNNCLGIFLFDIHAKFGGSDCPTEVQKAFSNYKKGSYTKDQYNKKISNVCDSPEGSDKCSWLYIDNAKNYDIDLSKKQASCAKPQCESFTTNKVAKLTSYAAKSNFVKELRKLWPDKFNNSEGVYGVDAWLSFGKKMTNYCEEATCPTLLAKLKSEGLTKVKMNKLNALFDGRFNKLDYDLMMEEYGNDEAEVFKEASCQSIPICAVKETNASCVESDSTGKFTIKDATIDTLYNSGKEFNMNLETFATLTKSGRESCLNNKVAYNRYKNGVTQSSVTKKESKETSEYGTPSNPATCWEEVTFSFPKSIGTDGESVIAGNLFRWGIDGDFENTKSNNFGTMRIHRYCTITKYIGKNVAKVGSQWANVIDGDPLLGADIENDVQTSTAINSTTYNSTARVNPKITLNYKQALPTIAQKDRDKYVSVTKDLKVDLLSIKQSIYDRKDDGTLSNIIDPHDYIDYSNSYCNATKKPTLTLLDCMTGIGVPDNHPRRSTIDNKNHPLFFKNGGVIEVVADYTISYSDDFKWYSDVSDNYSKKTEEEVVNEITKIGGTDIKDYPKYVNLGYGLPTSFVTPTKKLKGGENYGYDITDEEGNGYLYVSLSQIGTKSEDKSYHFDNLINMSIKDDDKNGITDAVIYSCGFSVKNLLYGYDCPNDNCTKKCVKGQTGCQVNFSCPNGNCTPKDIDVVFRTVELASFTSKQSPEGNEGYSSYKTKYHRAFPGRSGKMDRDVGANWKTLWKYSFDESYLIEFLNAKVYSGNPRYVIDLNPKLIQKIRAKNTESTYTSMENYKFAYYYFGGVSAVDSSKFLGECKDATGNIYSCGKANASLDLYALASSGHDVPSDVSETYAASEFLTDLINSGDLKGGCIRYRGELLNDTQKRADTYAETMGC